MALALSDKDGLDNAMPLQCLKSARALAHSKT